MMINKKHMPSSCIAGNEDRDLVQMVRGGGRVKVMTACAEALYYNGCSLSDLPGLLARVGEILTDPPAKPSLIDRIVKRLQRRTALNDQKFGHMESVEIEDVDWLYKPTIPKAGLTMLDGPPGVGKSTFTAGVAAAVSRGKRVPWSRDCPLGRVLFFSAEDDAARVLKPRLEAHAADMTQIRFQLEPFTLDDDGIASLRAELLAYPAVLVIVDPIVAYMGSDNDMNKAGDMTRFLGELSAIAREFNCAMLLVRHLKKSGDGGALYQGLGSIAVIGTVRSGLLLGRHPDDRDMRALAHYKSNWAKEGHTITFSLQSDGDDAMPYVKWGEPDPDISADDIVAAMSPPPRQVGRPLDQLPRAIEFLREQLEAGAVSKNSVIANAEAKDISAMTLRRAAKELKIKMGRIGKQSMWSLP